MIRRLLLFARRVAAQFGPYARLVRRLPCAVCFEDFYRLVDDGELAATMESSAAGHAPDCHALHNGMQPNQLVPLCCTHAWVSTADPAEVTARAWSKRELLAAPLPALAARLRRIYSTLPASEA